MSYNQSISKRKMTTDNNVMLGEQKILIYENR